MGITGMHCASCTANTEKALKKLDGVQSASVNIATESATVKFDPAKVSTAEMEKAVTDLGYTPHVREERTGGHLELKVVGMDNPHCLGTVKGALNSLKGIISKELFINERARIDRSGQGRIVRRGDAEKRQAHRGGDSSTSSGQAERLGERARSKTGGVLSVKSHSFWFSQCTNCLP